MEISQLSQKLAQTDKRQEDLEKQVGHLLQYHTDVQKALAQYKDKINEVERHISLHNQTLAEVMKVKDHLKILSDMIATEGEGRSLQSYRVKAGDSLDKIAKEHKTSAETLRKINHMNNDLILAGQDLLVPKRVD
jgi:LysM repeat protein